MIFYLSFTDNSFTLTHQPPRSLHLSLFICLVRLLKHDEILFCCLFACLLGGAVSCFCCCSKCKMYFVRQNSWLIKKQKISTSKSSHVPVNFNEVCITKKPTKYNTCITSTNSCCSAKKTRSFECFCLWLTYLCSWSFSSAFPLSIRWQQMQTFYNECWIVLLIFSFQLKSFLVFYTHTHTLHVFQKNETDIFIPIRLYVGELNIKKKSCMSTNWLWHRYWSTYKIIFLARHNRHLHEQRLCSLKNSHLRWISIFSIYSFNAMNKI